MEDIDPEQCDATEVLALRLQIYSALKKWESMQAVAKSLAFREPDNPHWSVSWAYGTRRADSIEAARIILLSAVERQPEIAVFHYNLACYECQLGDVEVAKARLQHAFKLDSNYRLLALDDEDLKPLWESLRGS